MTKPSKLLYRRAGKSDNKGWVLPKWKRYLITQSLCFRSWEVEGFRILSTGSKQMCSKSNLLSDNTQTENNRWWNRMLTIMVFRRAANNDIPVIRSPTTDNDISVIWRHHGSMQIYIAYSEMKLDMMDRSDGVTWWLVEMLSYCMIGITVCILLRWSMIVTT